jgi:hypothetical protein
VRLFQTLRATSDSGTRRLQPTGLLFLNQPRNVGGSDLRTDCSLNPPPKRVGPPRAVLLSPPPPSFRAGRRVCNLGFFKCLSVSELSEPLGEKKNSGGASEVAGNVVTR